MIGHCLCHKLPRVEELSAEAFMRHASAVLSVALQCGNVDIATKGAQALRLQQAQRLSLRLPRGGSRLQRAGSAAAARLRRLRQLCSLAAALFCSHSLALACALYKEFQLQ